MSAGDCDVADLLKHTNALLIRIAKALERGDGKP